MTDSDPLYDLIFRYAFTAISVFRISITLKKILNPKF